MNKAANDYPVIICSFIHYNFIPNSICLNICGMWVTSIKQRRGGKSQAYPFPTPPLKLLPQTEDQLSTRLGVMPSSIKEAVEKGEDYFKDWSKRRDPASRAWQKRGNLFHPLYD